MAQAKIPDPLSRRYLLERELDPARALGLAEAYLEQGREIEALDFLTRAGATDRIEALRDAAIERGDVFLLRASSAQLGVEPGPEVWSTIAETAARAGRERDAETATRLAAIDG